MTLDQMRVFVAVAERRHVTRAAEALHLAQSAVSAAIATVESRYGVKLLHKVGRGIDLTDAGRAFLPVAQDLLRKANEAELVLSELGSLKRGRLTVCASKTVANYWLPRRIVDFRTRFPLVDLDIRVLNSTEALQAIEKGLFELAFVEMRVDSPDLRVQELARDQLLVLVNPDHPWADGAPVTGAMVREADWVLRERGSGTRALLEEAFATLGLSTGDLRVFMALPTNEAVRSAIEAGPYATALSASVAAASLEAGLLVRAGITLPDRPFCAVWRTDRQLSKAAQTLVDLA